MLVNSKSFVKHRYVVAHSDPATDIGPDDEDDSLDSLQEGETVDVIDCNGSRWYIRNRDGVLGSESSIIPSQGLVQIMWLDVHQSTFHDPSIMTVTAIQDCSCRIVAHDHDLSTYLRLTQGKPRESRWKDDLPLLQKGRTSPRSCLRRN
jgi:hypothetical protein